MADQIRHRYSISQVTQGNHKFYTCTIPSDVLSRCCMVTTREADPIAGFQRLLDEKRAKEIAFYIDSGLGTIPCSIILSAQTDADLRIIGKGKTVEFVESPRSFLILDGQHRVWGFSFAESTLRVPVVIYNGLSRKDESRLFIDINSKQRSVPNELLLDIKNLAEYENDEESRLRMIFDYFDKNSESAYRGKLSPSSHKKNKISRVTFNNSVKPLMNVFADKPTEDIYEILNSYFIAITERLNEIDCEGVTLNSTVFRAICAFFPTAAAKLRDQFGSDYSEDNFYHILDGLFSKVRASKFQKPGNSYKALWDYLEQHIKTEFRI